MWLQLIHKVVICKGNIDKAKSETIMVIIKARGLKPLMQMIMGTRSYVLNGYIHFPFYSFYFYFSFSFSSPSSSSSTTTTTTSTFVHVNVHCEGTRMNHKRLSLKSFQSKTNFGFIHFNMLLLCSLSLSLYLSLFSISFFADTNPPFPFNLELIFRG